MLSVLRHQYLAILWSVFVLIMCNLPLGGSDDLPLFEGFDKLVHLGFFFVLTVLLFFGKIREQLSYTYRTLTIVKILLITAALGGSIELLQWKVFTYRGAEWWDFFADMLGVCMGIFSYMFLHRTRFNEKLI